MRVQRELPLSSIRIDRLPFDRVLEFVAAFKNGVGCRPIHVRLDPKTGLFHVLDGRHRYMAAKLLGWKTIPVIYGVPEVITPAGRRETTTHRFDLTEDAYIREYGHPQEAHDG